MDDNGIFLIEEKKVEYSVKIQIFLIICTFIQLMGLIAIALEKNHVIKLESVLVMTGLAVLASGAKWYLSTEIVSKTFNIFTTLASVFIFILIFNKL